MTGLSIKGFKKNLIDNPNKIIMQNKNNIPRIKFPSKVNTKKKIERETVENFTQFN